MMRFSTLFALAATLMACHANHDDDVAPTDERHADADERLAQAKRVVIDADDLTPEQVDELASHIQGIGDVAQAKVEVRQDHEGHTEVLVEIAGRDLPGDDYLQKEIASFDGLEEADIVVQTVHPDEVAAPTIDKDESPEQIKAEVEAQLREQGVEGEVHVDVIDEDGERRVEVRVEKDDDVPGDLVAK